MFPLNYATLGLQKQQRFSATNRLDGIFKLTLSAPSRQEYYRMDGQTKNMDSQQENIITYH